LHPVLEKKKTIPSCYRLSTDPRKGRQTWSVEYFFIIILLRMVLDLLRTGAKFATHPIAKAVNTLS
jgi:hypothetical protein